MTLKKIKTMAIWVASHEHDRISRTRLGLPVNRDWHDEKNARRRYLEYLLAEAIFNLPHDQADIIQTYLSDNGVTLPSIEKTREARVQAYCG